MLITTIQQHIIVHVFIVYLPVVDYFHCAILLNPQFAQNDIVYTAVRVTPCVCFVVPEGAEDREGESRKDEEQGRRREYGNMMEMHNRKWERKKRNEGKGKRENKRQ